MNSWKIILYFKFCLSQSWLMFAAEIWSAGSMHVQEYTLKPRNSVYKATLLRIDEDIFSAHCHIMYMFLNIHLHLFCFSDSHCLLMFSVLNGRIKFKLQASCVASADVIIALSPVIWTYRLKTDYFYSYFYFSKALETLLFYFILQIFKTSLCYVENRQCRMTGVFPLRVQLA